MDREFAPTIDVVLVQRLVSRQFPQWADLPISLVQPGGFDYTTFRIGEEHAARLPNAARYISQAEKEFEWLPKLAPHLRLPISNPVAVGKPSDEYPWPWSVNRWLPGEIAHSAKINDLEQFARDIAEFLKELHKIGTTGGPLAGEENFHRGGYVGTYDEQTRTAIASLGGRIVGKVATAIWEEALASQWEKPGVWVHGDFAPLNLLVNNGKLSAVIDFGRIGVGDPACDLVIAWTFFVGREREVFREAMELDDATWARARGWALWKAAILTDWNGGSDSRVVADAPRVLSEVLI